MIKNLKTSNILIASTLTLIFVFLLYTTALDVLKKTHDRQRVQTLNKISAGIEDYYQKKQIYPEIAAGENIDQLLQVVGCHPGVASTTISRSETSAMKASLIESRIF